MASKTVKGRDKSTTPTAPTQITELCELEKRELCALEKIVEDKRNETGIVLSEPRRPQPSVVPSAAGKQLLTTADEIEKQKLNERRWNAWRLLVHERGERYESCHVTTFKATHPEQSKALEVVARYCEHVKEAVRAGQGLLLYGPRGTGKDHLAMAACRAAIGADFTVKWQNGMDMFGDIRDRMDDECKTEKQFVERLIRPDVLYLSDPLPPFGTVTQFQATMLFRIFDGRYSRGKPIIVTCNVSSGAELDERLGSQNGDRLRDNSDAVFCNWPTYRGVRANA